MGITAVHIDVAVEALQRSMQTLGLSEVCCAFVAKVKACAPQADQKAAMSNLQLALPPFKSAALRDAPVTCADDVAAAPPFPDHASPYEAAAIASLGSKQLLTLAVNLFFRKYAIHCVGTDCITTLTSRVMADPSLVSFFSHYTPQALRPKLVSFLAFSLGINPQPVEELQAVHAPLIPRGLTMAHYDSVLEHYLTTLQQLRVDQALVQAARVNLTSMRVVFEDLLDRANP